MSTYPLVSAALGRRDSRKVGNHTYLHRNADGGIALRLHVTDILTFAPDGAVTIDVRGWRTVTTKDRLLSYLPEGWAVAGHRQGKRPSEWWLHRIIPGEGWAPITPYRDGITIRPDGSLTDPRGLLMSLTDVDLRIAAHIERRAHLAMLAERRADTMAERMAAAHADNIAMDNDMFAVASLGIWPRPPHTTARCARCAEIASTYQEARAAYGL